MVIEAQNRVLHANEVPRGLEILANKFPFPDISPCKRYLISGPPWEVGYGLHIHFLPWLFGTIHCLFPSRSAMESHEEGLCLQSHSLISGTRPLCAPSHNRHQACHRQGQSWWDKLNPSAPPPHFPHSILCSFKIPSSTRMSKRLRTPWLCLTSSQVQGPSNQLWLSHISDCTFPPPEHCLSTSLQPCTYPGGNVG
jgi:hypothetical protein